MRTLVKVSAKAIIDAMINGSPKVETTEGNLDTSLVKLFLGKVVPSHKEITYSFPNKKAIFFAIRQERDDTISLHRRNGNVVRDLKGRFSSLSEFETRVKACNNLMLSLREEKSS